MSALSIEVVREKESIKRGNELWQQLMPANCKYVIVAEKIKDESDPMTDYFGERVEDTIILAPSATGRNNFAEMRRAATRIPETKHMGPGRGNFTVNVEICTDFYSCGKHFTKGQRSPWHRDLQRDEYYNDLIFMSRAEASTYTAQHTPIREIIIAGKTVQFCWRIIERSIEHRENYSLGRGYYLQATNNPWRISKRSVGNFKDDLLRAIVLRYDHLERQHSLDENRHATNITLMQNIERGGLELRFPAKPSHEIIQVLKAHHWRWSFRNGCWWTKYSDSEQAFALSLVHNEAEK